MQTGGRYNEARYNELKEDDVSNTPGIFSKATRITAITSIDDHRRTVTIDEAIRLIERKQSDDVIWIDFQGIAEGDMHKIESYFKLHPLTIEDCTLPDTREKYEVFEGYYFIVVNEMHYMEYSNILNNVNLCVIVFPQIVLSFHAAPVQTMHEVIRKLSFENKIPSSDWLVYALLDGVVDIYVTLVDQIVREADSLDDLVLLLSGVDQTELLERIGYANRHSGYLKSGLWSKREILGSLRENDNISQHIRLYMQNVADHVVRCDQKLKLARHTIGSLTSAYLAKVSIELADASNHMNSVMGRLSAISATFLPLTLIAGIFGMNVRIPGNVGFDDTPEGFQWFIGILVFMSALAVAISVLFKWKKWL